MVGRAIVPQDVHILMLGTCDYVTLHRKKEFAEVIKVMDLKMGEIILDYLRGADAIT